MVAIGDVGRVVQLEAGNGQAAVKDVQGGDSDAPQRERVALQGDRV